MGKSAVILGALLVALFPVGEPACAPLFDGHSLAGWTVIGGKPGNWGVESGQLVTFGRGKDWLSTNRPYANFELRLEYQTGPAGNSGVLLRAPHRGDPSFAGLEIQILDDEAPIYRSLQPAQYAGSIYGVVAARRGAVHPAGEWNALAIRAVGTKVAVTINGIPVVAADLADYPQARDRHPGLGRASGFIGLQSHGDPIRFRHVTIQELP